MKAPEPIYCATLARRPAVVSEGQAAGDLNIEAERPKFEAAINDTRFFPRELNFARAKSPGGRDEYASGLMESAWQGWQLARRRPAAPAPEARDDTKTLRRWAEQVERIASTFNDERSLLCQQASVLLYRIAYEPATKAAPVAEAPTELAKLARYKRVNYKMLIADDGEFIKFDDAVAMLREQGSK